MSLNIKQIHLGDVDGGLAKPIAVFSLEPTELTARTGIKFEVTRDDLDYLQAAIFETPTGGKFALIRHQHAPNSGTELLVDEKTENLRLALDEAMSVLEMNPSELQWIHPDIS